ncbi:MAG: peptidoglycan-binding protein [Bryobacterales bacterium]|nr:peptidoglycan-binding protein [Bryobacterales bacterium]
MAKQHTANGGDSVESIAYEHGHFWETVWNDGANSKLRAERKDHNILEEGDVVSVPDLRQKEVAKPVDQRHRFRRKGVPSKIEVRLTEHDDEPRVGVNYSVKMGKRTVSGTTDGDGWIRFAVMPDVRKGVISLPDDESYGFEVGTVRPATLLKGVQGRLRNLGYFKGALDGMESEELAEAIRWYQRDRKMAVTGEADAAVMDALESAHGS